MARVYRRTYRCKRTDKNKQVQTYTLTYRDEHGQQVREPTKLTQKRLAEQELRKRLREVEQRRSGNGMATGQDSGAQITLEELADGYIAACRLRLKSSTCDLYEERLDHILGQLDVTHPEEIRLAIVDDYTRQRLEIGRATRTPNLEISILRRALNFGVQRQLIERNPLKDWRPIKDKPRRKRRALAPDEVGKLLAIATSWRRLWYMTLLASAIRKGESTKLLIEDLDIEKGALRVRPEIAKTGRGRCVPLPSALVAMLVAWLRDDVPKRQPRQEAYLKNIRKRLTKHEKGNGDSEAAETLRVIERRILETLGHRYLFANDRGLPLRCNLLRAFRTDLLNAGVASEGLDLHSLRYTANTTMLAAGLNPAVIRARMGHSSAAMTDLYTDQKQIIDNGDTSAVAGLLGLPINGQPEQPGNGQPGPLLPPGLQDEKPLRPSPEILEGLVERYTNGLIGRICGVSNTAVGKWLKAAGIKRNGKKKRTGDLPEWQIALLRADLRKAGDGNSDLPSPG